MMKILAGASESEFDVDEPEEVRDHSDNKLASTAAAKTPDKSVQPAKSTPARKKKKLKVSDDEEEILSKKKRGSKAKPQRRATKVLEVESEDDEEDEDIEEYEEEDEEDEEEEYDQRPKAKPAKKFTSGAFVVLKTDMIYQANPFVWKIDGDSLLQRFIPFIQDGKLLYKKTTSYAHWCSHLKVYYYSAPVSLLKKTKKEHIIKFYKNKIKRDPSLFEELHKIKKEEEES